MAILRKAPERDRKQFWAGILHIGYGFGCAAVATWVPVSLPFRIAGYVLAAAMLGFGYLGISES